MSEVEKKDVPQHEVEERQLTFIEKLADVQSRLKAPKGQYNSFGKYKYRSCEDILEAVKPLLREHGLILTLTDEVIVVESGVGPGYARFYVKATAIVSDGVCSGSIGNSIRAEAYAREDETKKGMDGSQITGTASSYARKYALNGLFLIDDTKDADATNDHGKAPQRPQEPATDEFRKIFGNYKRALGVDGKTALSQLQLECEFDCDPKELEPSKRQQVQEHMIARIAEIGDVLAKFARQEDA